MSYTPGAMAIELLMRAREKESTGTTVWTQEDLNPVLTTSVTDAVATMVILARLLAVTLDKLAKIRDEDTDELVSRIALMVAQSEI